MLRQLAILRLLSITVTVCFSGDFSCYAAQQQHNQSQEPDSPIVTQYNNATRTSRSLLQGIPVPISETDEFNHLYVNAAADYSRGSSGWSDSEAAQNPDIRFDVETW
jgi:hypothetical protein